MTRDRNGLLERVERALPREPQALRLLRERRDRRTLRRRVAAGAVGVAITVVIAGVGVAVLEADDALPPVPGGSANPTVPLTADPGDYYYTRAWSWYPGEGISVGEMWVGPDGSGRMLREERSHLQSPEDQMFGSGDFPGVFVPELATDPGELLRQLTERASTGQPLATTSPGRTVERSKLLRSLEDLFANTLSDRFVVVVPEQKLALFQVASTLDEIVVEEAMTDPFGRPAVRLSWVVDYETGSGSLVVWYFEPSTGQFMGELWVDARSGEIESAHFVTHAGVVPSREDRPTPGASYVPEARGKPDLGPIELPRSAV